MRHHYGTHDPHNTTNTNALLGLIFRIHDLTLLRTYDLTVHDPTLHATLLHATLLYYTLQHDTLLHYNLIRDTS